MGCPLYAIAGYVNAAKDITGRENGARKREKIKKKNRTIPKTYDVPTGFPGLLDPAGVVGCVGTFSEASDGRRSCDAP